MNALATKIEATEAVRSPAVESHRPYYVALIVPGREQRFIDRVTDLKIDFVMPMESRTIRCGARSTRTIKRGLLGPYSFLRFAHMEDEYQRLKEIPEFRRLLRINDYYPMVSELKVQLIVIAAEIIAGRLSTDNPNGYQIGDKVRIKSEKLVTWPDGTKGWQMHAFSGFVGTIIELPSSQRLMYVIQTEVTFLGGKIKIKVGADEFDPA